MVLTTPEALEQRTALATRAVEELRGYGLNVQDTVASVVDRTTARFSSQREVIDHTFLDGARADLVRRYGGQNAEGALATMRARDFILHDVQRVQNGYDNFLDGRTSPGMLANSLETLQNELTRYADLNRFDSQSQRYAREAGEVITRLMESLRHYPDDMNQRIDVNNRIFHDFNSLERAMDNFASGTNNQIMALLESRAEPAVQVAQAPQPPPRTTSVRTRETMVSQQFGGMRDGGYVQIPREQRIEPPAVVVRQEPVQQPRVEAPQRPVVEEPQRTREPQPLPQQVARPSGPSVRPIPPIEPVVVQTPTTTVRTSERPAVAVQQGLIAIDTPAGQRQLGVLLRTQNPQEPEFSQQQLAEVGRVFSEVRRYAHFREEWNQTAQDGLLRAYHEGGRAQFLNELGTFAQMSYNPDRDTNPSDSRLDGIRASMRSTTVAATRTEAPVQERRQEAIVTENPSVTMFNDRVRDGNQTVDGVRDAAARVHQARLDAEEAARRGDATAFERAQRIAREATPANPMQSFDNYLGYARGAKDQVPTAERRGIEPTYRALEGRRRELSGYQTAIDADLAAIGRIRIQRTEVQVPTYTPQGQIRGNTEQTLSPDIQAQVDSMVRTVRNANLDAFDLQNRLGVLGRLSQERVVSLTDLVGTINAICSPANRASAERKAADINRSILRYESEALTVLYQRFVSDGSAYMRDNESGSFESRLRQMQTNVNEILQGRQNYNPQNSSQIVGIITAFRQIHDIAVQNLGYEENERQMRAVMQRAGMITSV